MEVVKPEPVAKPEISEEGRVDVASGPLQPVKKEDEPEHGGLTDVRVLKDEARQLKAEEPKKEKDSDDEKLESEQHEGAEAGDPVLNAGDSDGDVSMGVSDEEEEEEEEAKAEYEAGSDGTLPGVKNEAGAYEAEVDPQQEVKEEQAEEDEEWWNEPFEEEDPSVKEELEQDEVAKEDIKEEVIDQPSNYARRQRSPKMPGGRHHRHSQPHRQEVSSKAALSDIPAWMILQGDTVRVVAPGPYKGMTGVFVKYIAGRYEVTIDATGDRLPFHKNDIQVESRNALDAPAEYRKALDRIEASRTKGEAKKGQWQPNKAHDKIETPAKPQRSSSVRADKARANVKLKADPQEDLRAKAMPKGKRESKRQKVEESCTWGSALEKAFEHNISRQVKAEAASEARASDEAPKPSSAKKGGRKESKATQRLNKWRRESERNCGRSLL